MKNNQITKGTKVETLSGTATIIEVRKKSGTAKIKHDMPNGNGAEEWMMFGQLRIK
jgi:hypothetical protein